MLRWKEEFVGNTQRKCVHVHHNGDFDHGKVLYMEPDWTYLDFLNAASQRLNMVPAAKRMFNADGLDVDDCMMIEDNDILFLSIVDEFIAPPNISDGNNSSDQNKHGRSENEKIPSSVGGYKVGDLLGKGGFGEVRIGEHQLTLEKVALKFLRKSDIHSLGAAERTNTEIQCLTALKHMNIIRLHQHMETANHVVLVFELMQGGDLMKYLLAHRDRSGKTALSEDEGKHVFYQILSGISFAHSQHICHRDLKLENVLLKDNSLNCVKIADFGLSDFYRPGATMKSNCGTLSFLAPEVFKGTSNAGPPLDVWSLGVILFAILCGRLPFEGSDLIGTKRPREPVIKSRILKCNYKIDEHLGPEAKDLVRRMLQVDPSERASLPEILNHVWLRSASSNSHFSEPMFPLQSATTSGSFNKLLHSSSLSNSDLASLNHETHTSPMKAHRRGSSFVMSSRESSDSTGTGSMDMFSLGLNLDAPPPPKSPFSSPLVTPSKSPLASHSKHSSITPIQLRDSNNGRLIVSGSDGYFIDSPRSNKSGGSGSVTPRRVSDAHNASSISVWTEGSGSGRTSIEDRDINDRGSGAQQPAAVTTYKLVPLRRSNSSNKDGSTMELFSTAVLNNNSNNSSSINAAYSSGGGKSGTDTLFGSGARSNSDLANLNKPTDKLSRPNTAVTFLPRRQSGTESDASQQQDILVSSYAENGSKKVSSFTLPKREIASAHSGHSKTYGNTGIASEKDSTSSPNPRDYKSSGVGNKYSGITSGSSGTPTQEIVRGRNNTVPDSTASYMNPIRRGDADHKRHSTPHNNAQPLFDTSSPVQHNQPVYDYSTHNNSPLSTATTGNRVRSQSGNPSSAIQAGGRVRFL